MGLTEQEYAEAFGVELENSENPTRPSEEVVEGEGMQGNRADFAALKGQGGAQNAETGSEDNQGAGNVENQTGQQGSGGTDDSAVSGEPGEGGPKPGEMSPEERHRQAAARRARENQAREAATQARVDKVFADMFAGQVNPYTGKPILSEADFQAYQAEKARRQQAAQLEKAGIEPDTIRDIVDQQLAPLQQRLRQAELSAMQEKARAVNARAQEAIRTSLKNISAMDPGVKTLEDIAALPTAGRFNELVQKGIGLEDAFYLANRQAIDTRRAAAAKAAALNGASNRRHLDPVPTGSGKQTVEVPAEQAEMFREMMPGATDEEIRTAYAGYLKDMGM